MIVINTPGTTYFADSFVQFSHAGYDQRVIEVHKIIEGVGERYVGMIYRERDAAGKLTYSALDNEAGELFPKGATVRSLAEAKRLFREKHEDERDKERKVELNKVRSRKKTKGRNLSR